MTTRMTISIDDDIAAVLQVVADREVRTLANLAAAIVTQKARELRDTGTVTEQDVAEADRKSVV